MSTNDHQDATSKTLSSSEFFETIGQKASQTGQVNGAGQQDGEDDGKVVEEIESLCMNCHENVSRPHHLLDSHALLVCMR